jgi:hypothetical protein
MTQREGKRKQTKSEPPSNQIHIKEERRKRALYSPAQPSYDPPRKRQSVEKRLEKTKKNPRTGKEKAKVFRERERPQVKKRKRRKDQKEPRRAQRESLCARRHGNQKGG